MQSDFDNHLGYIFEKRNSKRIRIKNNVPRNDDLEVRLNMDIIWTIYNRDMVKNKRENWFICVLSWY